MVKLANLDLLLILSHAQVVWLFAILFRHIFRSFCLFPFICSYYRLICDFLNLERDDDGFCLLIEEKQNYRIYLDCGYEKFKINGDKKPPFLINIIEQIRRVIFYPAIGC